MGLLDSIFGGGEQESRSQTTQKLPPWLEEYAKGQANFQMQGMNDASRIYEMMKQYQPYPEQRIAGFSNDTRDAMNMARNGRAKYQGYMGGAANEIKDAGHVLDGMGSDLTAGLKTLDKAEGFAGADPTVYGNMDKMSALMNPYIDNVVDRTTSNMERAGDRQRLADQGRAGRVGAAGGGRLGVVDAMRESETQRNIGDMEGTMRKSGWDTALGTLGSDLTRRIGAADSLTGIAAGRNANANTKIGLAQTHAGLAGTNANLAQTQAGLDRGSMQDMLGIGSLQEGKTQQSLDLGYKDFLEQRDYPMKAYDFWSAAINKQPLNPAQYATQTTTGTQPGPSWLSQLAGGAMAGVGLYGMTR